MKLNDMSPAPGSKKTKLRVGRGASAGQGKTCGRGVKGQRARKGGYHKVGFEGGQMPLQRRLPKIGFTNIFRTRLASVNVGDLVIFEAGARIDETTLRAVGLVRGRWDGVKILGDGDLDRALTIVANKFSQSAQEKIQAAGGKVEALGA